MEITKDKAAKKLLSYLQNKISLTRLIDWAENTIMEADFREGEEKTLREVLGKLGLADVREFGLSWEDSEKMMRKLGYKIRVDATAA
ncbi:MAG: hypothetical protein LH473_13985 [Chitinophagales bacterium]|nr:hypothetical protein [Chitinophagales bacterium]